MPSEQPRVLHYIQRWLPLSEPFVYGLVTKSRSSAMVVSTRRPENTDSFPFQPLYSFAWIDRRRRFRKYLGTAKLMYLTWRHSIDLIHVHHGYVADDVTGTCRRRGLPLVVSLHGHDITGLFEDHPTTYDAVIPLVSAVIVPSKYLASVAAAAGFPRDRLHVIPTGVDLSQFRPSPLPEDGKEVLFVGRFVEKKGLDVLLAAWPSVRRDVPEARLRILGFGPLEALARSGGDGVEVVLEPKHQEVRDAMRRAYAVVSPSRRAKGDAVESLLVVNLEAQASGRPVVTTSHGGIPEFVAEDQTALLVPEADPEALAAALVRLLRDRELASRLAAAGPGWVEQFDAQRCAERVDRLYRSLVATGGGSARRPGD